MNVQLRPLAVMARMTAEGSFRTFRLPGLLIVALLPSFALAGLVGYNITGASLVNAYENLELALIFPIILLLVTLLLGVPLLRDEIDDESIGYLLTRTLGKPGIVVGKYLGYVLTANLVLIPPVLLGYGVVAAEAGSASGMLQGVLPSLLVMNEVGIIAFGAVFLWLGVLTRHALYLGLVYAFLWEYLLGALAGFAPDLSIMHYLLSIPTFWVGKTTPLGSTTTALTLSEALVVPLLVAVIMVALSVATFWLMSIKPAPE